MGSRVTAKNTWPWCGTSTKPWPSVVRIEAKSSSHETSLHPPILAHTPLDGPKYAMKRHERVDLPETANVRMPTHAWCTVFLARFRRLQYVRIRLLQCFLQPVSLVADTFITFCQSTSAPRPAGRKRVTVPSVQDEARWYTFVHGRTPPSEQERQTMADACREKDLHGTCSDSESEVSDMLDVAEPKDVLNVYDYDFRGPSLRVLMQLDTNDLIALTKLFRKWMQHAQFAYVHGSRAAIHPVHAQWLFSLLACLDRRLDSDDIATLRVLARACIKCIVRTREQVAPTSTSDADFFECESGAWMIITIIAGIWGQLDLWNEAHDRLAEARIPTA